MDNEESKYVFLKISVLGIVQGVGFRPFVFRLAKELSLYGNVRNSTGQAEIVIGGKDLAVTEFINRLKNPTLPHIKVKNVEYVNVPPFPLNDFIIIESESVTSIEKERFFSADISVCDDCKQEIFNSDNRRNKHCFNTCVNCGPRFTVLETFPYDRKNTSMNVFSMCSECEAEYVNPSDRRFHAQTISCNNCGPELLYINNNDGLIKNSAAFQNAVNDLRNGKIVAVKGIGGYHLACLPFQKETISSLRTLKNRENKPFSVMFRDIEAVKKVCYVNETAENALLSYARPITLCSIKKSVFADGVLRGNQRCGCFLPYTPLQLLLFNELEKYNIDCLVMTSANISGSRIIKNNDEMIGFYNTYNYILIGVLYNERAILRSLEDSVVQVVNNDIQMIRRSRGYVPVSIKLNTESVNTCLAIGGDLKATFTLVKNGNAIMSGYIGDLEENGVNELFKNTIIDYIKLFDIKPDLIVCDKHPDYFSLKIAKELSTLFDVGLKEVFHHHAHIASVIAEHNLNAKVLGVAFDGTGYGADGNVWGGEFLLCEEKNFQRVGCLTKTKLLGGSEKNARKTALCFLHAYGLTDDNSHDYYEKSVIVQALDNNINTMFSTSMGRLFDAISSLLNICHLNSYEGECACLLQQYAEKAFTDGVSPVEMKFLTNEIDGVTMFNSHEIIKKASQYSDDVYGFALGFHLAVAKMLLKMCLIVRVKNDINTIALSGGVFQNSFLLEQCIFLLKKHGFSVYFNKLVPPNDSGISLGQAYLGLLSL